MYATNSVRVFNSLVYHGVNVMWLMLFPLLYFFFSLSLCKFRSSTEKYLRKSERKRGGNQSLFGKREKEREEGARLHRGG